MGTIPTRQFYHRPTGFERIYEPQNKTKTAFFMPVYFTLGSLWPQTE